MTHDPRTPWDDELGPPPTPEELAAAERLRDELDDPGSDHPDVELGRALRVAVDPRPIEPRLHAKILDRVVPLERPRNVWYPIGLALAVAAGFVFVAVQIQRGTPDVSASLAKSRSTQELFVAPFPVEGDTSKRVDTIFASRARDLRSNRYARWGVR